jgi:hypothetical protein
MLNQNFAADKPLPSGGQRVRLSQAERSTLWVNAIAFGLLCLLLLLGLGLFLAFFDLPLWGVLLLIVALALPGQLAQNRLLAVAADLRAGTAVVQTVRLDGLRRTGGSVNRCYARFTGAGEFSLDTLAYQRLQRRIGRRYRIVYCPSSRVLLQIEPML